jgi:polysaccharide export outer membrane protein/exopolysaccharide production protein ExoF
VEGERLRLQSNLMRVKQDVSRTEIDIIELRNRRTAEITSEIATTEARLEQLDGKIVTTRKLLAESEVIGAPPLLGLSQQKYTISYKIVRTKEGGPIEIAADEATTMEPGDTLKVEIVREPGNVAVGTVQTPAPVVGP